MSNDEAKFLNAKGQHLVTDGSKVSFTSGKVTISVSTVLTATMASNVLISRPNDKRQPCDNS